MTSAIRGVPLLVLLSGCAEPSSSRDCVGFLEPDLDGCASRPWPEARPEPLSSRGASGVSLALSSDGLPLVAWVQALPASVSQQSMLAEPDESGWDVRPLGTQADGIGGAVHLAVGNEGEALATWTQYATNNRSATYLASRDREGNWQLPGEGEPFSFPSRAYDPRPLILPTGEAFVVWNQGTQSGYGVALARQAPGDAFASFSFPDSAEDVLSPRVLFSNAPQLAVASNGDAVIAWYQSVGDGLSVFVSERHGPDGRFSRPAASSKISPDGARVADHPVRNPVVAIGARGEALVVWSQHHPSGAIGLYAAQRDGLRRWTFPTDIDDTFAPLREHATCADVVITETNEIFVVWFDGPPGNTNVYSAHRDEQGEWDQPLPSGALLSSSDTQAYAPKIATGGDGEVVAVWTELQAGVWTIVGRRRGPLADEWGVIEQLSERALGDSLAPTAAMNEHGTLVIAWEQGSFAEREVFIATQAAPAG